MAKLRHIAIAVEDVEKTAAFYEKAFDLKRVNVFPNSVLLSDGTVSLAILDVKRNKNAPNAEVGIHHIGFQIEDLDAAITVWTKLDRTVAEARLFPLAQFMGDVYASALLIEQAAWERAERGGERKALVARLHAQRYLADRGALRGIDAESDEALERFDELADGALQLPHQ